jgi:hypothetical protein
VFDTLVKNGKIQRRAIAASPALIEARDAVSRLVIKWDDALADRIAAQNLFLDQSKDRRRALIESLRARTGACMPPADFDDVENALRGRWTMKCERENLHVSITLAPTMPPKVQFLAVDPAPAVASRTDNCQ